jgi:hypothetical protein
MNPLYYDKPREKGFPNKGIFGFGAEEKNAEGLQKFEEEQDRYLIKYRYQWLPRTLHKFPTLLKRSIWELQLLVRLVTFAFIFILKKPRGPENLPNNDVYFLLQYFLIYDHIFWFCLWLFWWDIDYKEKYRSL